MGLIASHLDRVVLVANQKGGVGKSSIVAAVAGMIAGPTRRVLVIDADQQGNVSRNDLGVHGDKGKALAMALQYGQPLEPIREVRPGLDVLAGGPLLASVAGVVATAAQSGISIADNLADTLAALCARERYALVLVDAPPGEAPLLDALLHAARYLVVPTADDAGSLDGVELLAGRYLRAKASGAGIDLLGVVLFDVNPRATVRNQTVLDNVTDLLSGSGASVFRSAIRTDKAAAIDMREKHLTPGELVAAVEEQKQHRLERLADGQGSLAISERLWSRDAAGLATDYQNLAREMLARVSEYEGRHRTAQAAS
jgi:cellulose biosynthesis protein BcsQ